MTVTKRKQAARGEMALGSVGAASLTRAKLALALGLLIAGGAGVAALQTGGGPPREAKREQNAQPPAQEAKSPRVDRFGDPLPQGAIARLGTMRLRHGNGTSVVFASDGKSLITCGTDRTIRTWDTASGRLLREQHLPTGILREPAMAVLSPDARLVVFEELFGTLVLWDVQRDKLRHKFPIASQWPHLVFSPDSKMLAAAETEGTLHVWDTTAGKGLLLGRHGKHIHNLSFAADGTLMSLGDDKTLRFWDLTAGRERSRLTLNEPIPRAAISPDGRVVAVTTYFDKEKSVRFWDAATGKPLPNWKDWDAPALRAVLDVQFAPDGKTILISMEDRVIVWDPVAGQRVRTLPGTRGMNFAFSPDGKTVASLGGYVGGGFTLESMVRVWDLTTGQPHAANRPENGLLSPAHSLGFSPNGRTLISASTDERNVRLWDTATSRPLGSLPVKGAIWHDSLSFTPDGKELFLGDGSAIVRWDIASRRELRRYSPDEKEQANSDVMVLHLCEDGRTLLALSQRANGKSDAKPPANTDYALHAWDMATGERLRSVSLPVEEKWINYGRFSPDGRLFAIPGGSIRDVSTGEEVARLSVAGLSLEAPAAFSPDGALIAMAVQDEVKHGDIQSREIVAVQVWETATLSPVTRLTTGQVAHVAFTPDGHRLVSAGLDALTSWDIASGRAKARWPAPGRYQGVYGPSFASSLALSADGRTVATGNADSTILLWDVSTPRKAPPPAPLTAAQRDALWTDLAGDDANRALRAIARLADEPKQTVSLLRDRLRPAKAPPAEELRRLLADLDDVRFERREEAAKRLTELEDMAHAALRKALDEKPSLEVRRRIEGLLADKHRARTPEARRHVRAVRLLEQIATPEARQVLEGLARGAPDARLTRTAKAVLTRLARRTHP